MPESQTAAAHTGGLHATQASGWDIYDALHHDAPEEEPDPLSTAVPGAAHGAGAAGAEGDAPAEGAEQARTRPHNTAWEETCKRAVCPISRYVACYSLATCMLLLLKAHAWLPRTLTLASNQP